MIKNSTIREKIDKKTETRPAMRAFLTEIIENEYISSNYSKKYKAAIEKAVKDEEKES